MTVILSSGRFRTALFCTLSVVKSKGYCCTVLGGPQDHPQVQQFTHSIQHIVVILTNVHWGDMATQQGQERQRHHVACDDPMKPPMLSPSCEGILPTRGENAIRRLRHFSLEFRVLWDWPNCADGGWRNHRHTYRKHGIGWAMHSDRNTPEVWKLCILYTAEWGGRLLYTTDGGSGVVTEGGQSQGSIMQLASVGEYEAVVDTSAHTVNLCTTARERSCHSPSLAQERLCYSY